MSMFSAASTNSVRRWVAIAHQHPAAEHIEHDGQKHKPRPGRYVETLPEPVLSLPKLFSHHENVPPILVALS